MKKIYLALIITALACIIALTACGAEAAATRYRNEKMAEIQEQIDARLENSELYDFSFSGINELAADPVFVDFLAAQAKELCLNGKITVLYYFLDELEDRFPYSEAIDNALKESFLSLDDLDYAFSLIDRFERRKTYNFNGLVNRAEGVVAEYIRANGTNPITFTPGEGYYADCEDKSSYHEVGLEGSPLYDARNTVFRGDFKAVTEWGVDLNQYYEETPYGELYVYFRDNLISFDITGGAMVSFQDLAFEYIVGNNEFVWSGDYLFYFSANGAFIGYCEIE